MLFLYIDASCNPCRSASFSKKKTLLFIHLHFLHFLWTTSLIPPMNLSDSMQSSGKISSGSFCSSKNWFFEVVGNWGKGHQGAPEPHYNATSTLPPERGCGFPASTWGCGLSRSYSPKLSLKEVWTYLCPFHHTCSMASRKILSSTLYRNWNPPG